MPRFLNGRITLRDLTPLWCGQLTQRDRDCREPPKKERASSTIVESP
jgi:hypothetical protein